MDDTTAADDDGSACETAVAEGSERELMVVLVVGMLVVSDGPGPVDATSVILKATH